MSFKNRKEFEEALAKSIEGMKIELNKRCWDGYEPTPGKKPKEKGSCQPIEKDDKPHPEGSPKDAAHDVVEEHGDLRRELDELDNEGKRIMLNHIREYKKDPKGWIRSKKNK